MEAKEQYLKDLSDIRSIMEKSTRFLTLSGLSGVTAGIVALLGAALAKYLIHQDVFSRGGNMPMTDSLWKYGIMDISLIAVYQLFVLGIAIFAVALSFAYYFTLRRAKRREEKLWTPTSRRMLINLMIPLITGGVLAIILVQYQLYGLVAPITMIFYGLACVSASYYTPVYIRSLGLVMIALGLLSTQYIGYGLSFWAFGFGICHIIYGILLYIKYDRND